MCYKVIGLLGISYHFITLKKSDSKLKLYNIVVTKMAGHLNFEHTVCAVLHVLVHTMKRLLLLLTPCSIYQLLLYLCALGEIMCPLTANSTVTIKAGTFTDTTTFWQISKIFWICQVLYIPVIWPKPVQKFVLCTKRQKDDIWFEIKKGSSDCRVNQ